MRKLTEIKMNPKSNSKLWHFYGVKQWILINYVLVCNLLNHYMDGNIVIDDMSRFCPMGHIWLTQKNAWMIANKSNNFYHIQ